MADITTAQQIVAVAVGTRATHPRTPALDVLDLAMKGHEGSDLHFAHGPYNGLDDRLAPPSPFADLLRQAFAPYITASQMALWDSPNVVLREGFREMWVLGVVAPFLVRYRLG